MSKVFITGPDGLLGNNIIRELLSRKIEVKAMAQKGREPKTIMDLPIEIVYGDITRKEDLLSLSEGCDYFIHSAAVTDMWPSKSEHYYKINLEGTNNAIEAALKNKVKRFIYVGSASSFGHGSIHQPGNETTPYAYGRFNHDYLESKRRAQQLVLESAKTKQLPAIVVCPTFMIGPYDSKPAAGSMVIAVAKKRLPFVTRGGKNWVATKDVAVAIVNALDMGKIGEMYILGGPNLTYLEAVKKIAGVLNQSSYAKIALPDALILAAGFFQSMRGKYFGTAPKLSYTMSRMACEGQYYSPEKAIRELKMPQTSLEDSVHDLKCWFEENGYL